MNNPFPHLLNTRSKSKRRRGTQQEQDRANASAGSKIRAKAGQDPSKVTKEKKKHTPIIETLSELVLLEVGAPAGGAKDNSSMCRRTCKTGALRDSHAPGADNSKQAAAALPSVPRS